MLELNDDDNALVVINLSGGGHCIIDYADWHKVSRHKWTVNSKGYPCRSDWQDKKILMHRFLLGTPPNLQTDHRDANKRNNTRANLRVCTQTENLANCGPRANNSTGFKGVTPCGSRFRAGIFTGGRKRHLGTFGTPEEAARAYDAAAREVFGEFARTNFK